MSLAPSAECLEHGRRPANTVMSCRHSVGPLCLKAQDLSTKQSPNRFLRVFAFHCIMWRSWRVVASTKLTYAGPG